MARLGEILDRMPERKAPAAPAAPEPDQLFAGITIDPLDQTGKAAASLALYTMLGVLDGWIEGAHSNHEALGRRGERTDRLCWTEFHPSDIRRMVNDAARELGVGEFPRPAAPKEDEYR
jgi:hypothetical protein